MPSYSREIWKNIRGYEGYYQVSNLGQVKSLPRIVKMRNSGSLFCERMDGKPRMYKVRGKIMSLTPVGDYVCVALCKDEKENQCLVHRLVAEAFHGKCPKGMEARHLNGDGKDNRSENVYWGTKGDNGKDRIKHGTTNRGIIGSSYKLSREESLRIVKLRYSGRYTISELASMFQVSVQTIYYTLKIKGIRKKGGL